MKVISAPIPGAYVLEPQVFGDKRGFFFESYSQQRYQQNGIDANFTQDNVSFSSRGVLRGLHYQKPYAQAKLVQVLQGEVFDVAVDLRVGSPAFGKWYGVHLTAESHNQFYVPQGCAHGFVVLSETALFSYKCDDYYHHECEGGIIWNDPDVGIQWPITDVLLSDKDTRLPRLRDVSAELLFSY